METQTEEERLDWTDSPPPLIIQEIAETGTQTEEETKEISSPPIVQAEKKRKLTKEPTAKTTQDVPEDDVEYEWSGDVDEPLEQVNPVQLAMERMCMEALAKEFNFPWK